AKLRDHVYSVTVELYHHHVAQHFYPEFCGAGLKGLSLPSIFPNL
ncbi:10637_t:CDS:1, partial [Ambispora gerdemannii]